MNRSRPPEEQIAPINLDALFLNRPAVSGSTTTSVPSYAIGNTVRAGAFRHMISRCASLAERLLRDKIALRGDRPARNFTH